MRFDVLTLFPEMFKQFLSESIVGKAVLEKIINVSLFDIRDFADNRHLKVDDYPYGGGAGMVMTPQPLFDAMDFIDPKDSPVIYFTPQGRLLNQKIVEEYQNEKRVIMICGHYKEIDHRVRDKYVTDEISIGDYVLSGGELPAMIFIDAIARLKDGVISDIESARTDSHQNGLLGYPCYSRPADFRGMKVPSVLLSGHHKAIEDWRKEKSLEITKKIRPDLIKENEE